MLLYIPIMLLHSILLNVVFKYKILSQFVFIDRYQYYMFTQNIQKTWKSYFPKMLLQNNTVLLPQVLFITLDEHGSFSASENAFLFFIFVLSDKLKMFSRSIFKHIKQIQQIQQLFWDSAQANSTCWKILNVLFLKQCFLG